jgi:hypothetical protein
LLIAPLFVPNSDSFDRENGLFWRMEKELPWLTNLDGSDKLDHFITF